MEQPRNSCDCGDDEHSEHAQKELQHRGERDRSLRKKKKKKKKKKKLQTPTRGRRTLPTSAPDGRSLSMMLAWCVVGGDWRSHVNAIAAIARASRFSPVREDLLFNNNA